MNTELTDDLKNLLAHYTYKKNRIRAYANETKISEYIICSLFQLSQKELFLILHCHKNQRTYNTVKRDMMQMKFNSNRNKLQNLIRLR